MTPTSVIDKAQKLMALRDRAGTPAEAIAAAEALNRLLIKHHIEERDLNVAEASTVITKTVHLGARNMLLQVQRDLFTAVCDLNFSQSLFYPGSWNGEVVGHSASVDIIEETYAYLREEIIRLAKAEWKKYHPLHKARLGRSATAVEHWDFYKSFHRGAVIELRKRVREILTANDAVVETSALVVVLGAEVDAAVDQFFPRRGQLRRSAASFGSAEGWKRGTEAGRSMAMGPAKKVGEGRGRLNG